MQEVTKYILNTLFTITNINDDLMGLRDIPTPTDSLGGNLYSSAILPTPWFQLFLDFEILSVFIQVSDLHFDINIDAVLPF